MNKYKSLSIAAGLLVQGALSSGIATAQVADLNEIGTDPERAVIIDVMILADGTAEFIESYVTDVPPGTSIGNPQHIRLDSLDASSAIIGTEYSWDPRWVFYKSEMPDINGTSLGEELEELTEAKGSFSVLFDADLHSVHIYDMEAMSDMVTVNVRAVVENFCFQDITNSSDPSEIRPECLTMTFTDTDMDNVLDVQDNCPDVPNPGQEDVLNRGIGDACARPGDFDGDGDVDWQDTTLFWNGIIPHLPPGALSLSIPAYDPGSLGPLGGGGGGYDLRPMDLNGDGTINILDARKVVLLCDEIYCGWSV